MNTVLRTNGGAGFLQEVIDSKKTFEDPAFIEDVEKFEQCRFKPRINDETRACDLKCID